MLKELKKKKKERKKKEEVLEEENAEAIWNSQNKMIDRHTQTTPHKAHVHTSK